MAQKVAMTILFDRYRLFNHLIEGGDETNFDQRAALIDAIDKAVKDMPEMEKEIIQRRYITPESPYLKDYVVFEQLGITRAAYVNSRNEAFEKIAAAL
ncbi:DNA-directed RNA polymerase specialized sigma subunit [Paenibacillus endophyticus]|uniref:DNA-directed RNA polymerase specialized sigma subunit n=1 Tax=Paenibacillus endophyticus TaxID=1294268 RepID=A0A7W5G9H0_9BACL|nr:hypothetical protein [Paenibacillus endophyticus]MBB3151705.1 DNA-directed RNA polymerase specialized sigma subunit [Paenibacillus endophyticus]